MNLSIKLISISICLLLIIPNVFAQPQTKDEWKQAIQQGIQKRDALQKNIQKLQAEIDSLRKLDLAKAEEIRKLEQDIFTLTEMDESKAATYEEFLNKIDAYLNELAQLTNQDLWNRKAELDTVQNMIDDAKKSKASMLPANEARLKKFQERLDVLRASIKPLEPTEMSYTVGTWAKDRDCLWNIAKKPTIYENPFLWPKLWQRNREEIKNPDLIYQGQVLKVPPKTALTEEEKKAERSYWKKKRESTSPKQPV